MARFSMVIDLPGLDEDKTLHLNSLSDEQKRQLTRFMVANGEALLKAEPEHFGKLVEDFNYAVLQAFIPKATPDKLAPQLLV